LDGGAEAGIEHFSEMNGRDLAVRLQEIRPNLKFLYMSGYTADVIASHGVLATDVHFLQKPFTRATLSSAVHAALTEPVS